MVSSTNGELQGDEVGGQSNAPITAPADVENTETTKYVFHVLLLPCCSQLYNTEVISHIVDFIFICHKE